MKIALNDFEKFLHQQDLIPPLIKAAIVHAQFETIHPFVDGNGRIGRLLITFFLCQQKILRQPLLYISHYLKQNRLLYDDLLQSIRDTGDWESWVKFFLRGAHSVGQKASETARKIIALRENDRSIINKKLGTRSTIAHRLLDKLYSGPIVTSKQVAKMLNVVPATANSLLNKLVEIGILISPDKKKRNKAFRYQKYLNLFIDNVIS